MGFMNKLFDIPEKEEEKQTEYVLKEMICPYCGGVIVVFINESVNIKLKE